MHPRRVFHAVALHELQDGLREPLPLEVGLESGQQQERLAESGHPTAGFVLLIPHYLADTEYPLAAVSALESISAATGLIFPTDRLREENREFLQKVEDQVQKNSELQRLVGSLEERHDSYMEENGLPSPLVDIDGEVPRGDAIAAELERFLAERTDD